MMRASWNLSPGLRRRPVTPQQQSCGVVGFRYFCVADVSPIRRRGSAGGPLHTDSDPLRGLDSGSGYSERWKKRWLS